MKSLFTLLLLATVSSTLAQDPQDILKYSFYPQGGTARNVAIGGANSSLGGDISSVFINPAGLGLYKTSELVLTPGMGFNNNHNEFRGTEAGSSKPYFQLGTCGLIFGTQAFDESSKWKGHAFSIAVTKTADYNNQNYYKGLNSYSSFSDQYAEIANQSGQTIDGILNDPGYAFGTSLAIDTYLVDTFTTNSGQQYLGLPSFVLGQKIPLVQEKSVSSRGGLSEVALGYGANLLDRFYFGITVGIPILYYNETTVFTESPSTPDPRDEFVSSQLTENRIIKGDGIYARLGAIYKPNNSIRVGLAFTSPYAIGITESRYDTMTTNTGSYAGLRSAGSTMFLQGADPSNSYTAITPWRGVIGASYVFNAVEDVHKQHGFITADLEYVRYPGGRFKAVTDQSAGGPVSQNASAYFDALNTAVKELYKGGVNFKVGGELKLTSCLARLGFAYYSNPYKDATDLKAGKTVFSGGLGYRGHQIFVDLTYAYSIQKNIDFPYLLTEKSNTYANLSNHKGNLLLTFGVKF